MASTVIDHRSQRINNAHKKSSAKHLRVNTNVRAITIPTSTTECAYIPKTTTALRVHYYSIAMMAVDAILYIYSARTCVFACKSRYAHSDLPKRRHMREKCKCIARGGSQRVAPKTPGCAPGPEEFCRIYYCWNIWRPSHWRAQSAHIRSVAWHKKGHKFEIEYFRAWIATRDMRWWKCMWGDVDCNRPYIV